MSSGSRLIARILNLFSAAPAAESVDLRASFMLERSLTPALFVAAALAAVTSARLGFFVVIGWLAAATLNVVARGLLAARYESAGEPVSLKHGVGRAYAASWLIELLLWCGLLLAMAVVSPRIPAGPLVGACGVVVVAALTLGRWAAFWRLWCAAWLLAWAGAAVLAGGQLDPYMIAFPLWVAATWWLGRMPGRRIGIAVDKASRAGWSAAVRSMPVPVLVVRRGVLVDLNAAALPLLGGGALSQWIGQSLHALIDADAPREFDPLYGPASERESTVALISRGTVEPTRCRARIHMIQPGRHDTPVIIALLPLLAAAAPEPAAAAPAARTEPAGLAPAAAAMRAAATLTSVPAVQSGRDRDWANALPLLAWWVDAEGRVQRVHGANPWRWGVQSDGDVTGMQWFEAFGFDARGRGQMLTALQRALAGSPSFDVLHTRKTIKGAMLAVRSHVVPFADDNGAPGALVTDTIAAPQQLAAIDRLQRLIVQYKKLLESSTSLIWACDADFNFTFVSRRAAREMYGRKPHELLGQSMLLLMEDTPDNEAARAALAGLHEGRRIRGLEVVHRVGDSGRVIVSVDAAPLIANDGSFAGAIGMNANLTTLKQRERRLVEALRVERAVLAAAGQAIAVVKDDRVARCNQAFLQLLGIDPPQLHSVAMSRYFVTAADWTAVVEAADGARDEDQAATREVQLLRGAGGQTVEPMWCQLSARSIGAGEYVVVLADIDSIRHREEEALHHAHHDDLTGLPNRRLLALRGNAALAASALRDTACAVFAIDLDGFKEINDRFGHEQGDHVLREVAQRLGRLLRPQDIVARRGGDEFAMLVADVQDRADIERIAVRLLQAVEQPVKLDGGVEGHLSASVGVAIAPDHGRDLDRLLQLADLAMYEAKLKGKNRYALARMVGSPRSAAGAQRAAQVT